MAAGEKHIETRSWAPSSLHLGQDVAIHAGKGLADMSQSDFDAVCRREPYKEAIVRAYHKGLVVPRELGKLTCSDLPRGCIVAIAEFFTAYRTESHNCEQAIQRSVESGAAHEWTFGNYAPGRWAWVFVRIRPLDEPIPAKGAQGLWEWDAAGQAVR
ncbi:MAG TPA: hypothetical protein VF916_09925 [Ktedonobacterales bacterium]